MGREISPSLLFDKWIKLDMWIQFNNAFLSIVENRDNKLELLVRARIKGDIEKIFPEADVFEDDSADYKYRAFISKVKVAAKIMLKFRDFVVNCISNFIYLIFIFNKLTCNIYNFIGS